jgi:lysine 2,3-aminomutase
VRSLPLAAPVEPVEPPREEPRPRAARASARARPRPARCGPWQDELRRAATSVEDLERALVLTPEELAGARRAEAEGLPMRITPYYLSLCDKRDPTCPVRLQCVPRAEEGRDVPGDLADPLGEVAHEVAPHLVRRYPDRALLLVTDRCAVYCRFCTRSRMVGDGGGAVPMDALEPAFKYLEAHPEVRDVIVSGGDPLTLATARLARVLGRLRRGADGGDDPPRDAGACHAAVARHQGAARRAEAPSPDLGDDALQPSPRS